MKNQAFLKLGILLITINCFAQKNKQGNVIYKVIPKMIDNKIYTKTTDSSVINKYIRDYEKALTTTLLLSFNDYESIYISAKGLKQNEEKQIIFSGGDLEANVKINPIYANDTYVNLKTNERFKYIDDSLGIVYPIDTLKKKWNFTKETKLIHGFLCHKAFSIYKSKITRTSDRFVGEKIEETEFTTTVWFTKEIPSKFGPASFIGFPGLVLEVDLSVCKIEATEILFDDGQTYKIEKLKAARYITSEEHKEILKNRS
ncbi:GLPGLI family protein [Winogradskyella sp. R77965]|uniref:GLPGLI family protein n=1 Tax=Winogradskyella sp. R77965 TaxID=3093872 RepID=UPI0037DD2098